MYIFSQNISHVLVHFYLVFYIFVLYFINLILLYSFCVLLSLVYSVIGLCCTSLSFSHSKPFCFFVYLFVIFFICLFGFFFFFLLVLLHFFLRFHSLKVFGNFSRRLNELAPQILFLQSSSFWFILERQKYEYVTQSQDMITDLRSSEVTFA